MAKNKISEFSSTPANNTDIAGINIAEGCAPSGINNAIRELMAQLKDQQSGTDADNFTVGGGFTSVGAAVFSSTVAISGATTISGAVVMSSTVAMNGNNNIGNTTSSTILSGTVTQTTASKLYLDDSVTTSAAPPLSWDGDTDTGVYRPAANTMALVTAGVDRLRVNSSGVVIVGSGEATTSVAGNILRSPNATGTNITGANFEINAGNGTGTGGSGNIIVKTADVGSSGSTANTMTQRLLITKKGGFSFGSGSTDYGTAGQVLKSNGDAPPSFGSALISQTAQSATGTSIDFTGIPSWAKRITVMFSGVSTNGSSDVQIQLGDSGGIETTGYLGSYSGIAVSTVTTSMLPGSGFQFNDNGAAASTRQGFATITLLGSNVWCFSGTMSKSDASRSMVTSGTKSISDTLTQIRITTVNGTDTFDAGTINILYE
jgi:hypothetical protein